MEYKIKNIKLIKVDVDGYDYNILFSAINELKNNKPDIFFEYMPLDESGKKNYLRLIEKLNEIGYSNWTMLDNYGSIIFENKSYIDVIDKTKSTLIEKEVFDIYCFLKNITPHIFIEFYRITRNKLETQEIK